MSAPGPVSAFLEDELRAKVRQRGLVVWLDLDGHYTAFVDALARRRAAGELPFAVHGYRGSHLELLLELEEAAGGPDKKPLLLHLPGFTSDTVRATPLYELAAAGTQLRRKLDTVITDAAAGRVPPDRIAAFLQRGTPTLDAADAWLADQIGDRRGGSLPTDLEAMATPVLADELLAKDGPWAHRLREPGALAAVWAHLAARVGLRADWPEQEFREGVATPRDVAFVLASWALAVEYVDDLTRAPVDARLDGLRDLPRGVIDGCRALAAHLRERHGAFYQRAADESEGWLADEVDAARAEDLGRIDTFRFEEVRVLEGALTALEDERWSATLEWASTRVGATSSFWLRRDPPRRSAWQLVHAAADLGAAIEGAGPRLAAETLEEAVERYVAAGAAVDRAHRHLEQRRAALLAPDLPEFVTLRARLDELRRLWRRWADDWARDFNALCRRQGFLPAPDLQQRALFDDVVRAATKEGGTTALFVVDALRFEMAEELYRAIDGTPATSAHLRARLAELPTVTEVGMNVLAPVARDGRLAPTVTGGAFKGFSAGEFRVTGPETRGRAMWDRVGGPTCPWWPLADVLARNAASLRHAAARASLIVVHSTEIDAAGENGVGPAVFDQVLRDLRSAWQLLREAGVRRFVVTADHGFLLLDETAGDAQPHGRKIDPKRRHVVSTLAADHPEEVRVPLADLGYDDCAGLHLMFPASTAVFDTGRRARTFVHGGNSLQERVIPVLTVVHRAAAGSDGLVYAIRAEARDPVAGMSCLSARVEVVAQTGLAFGGGAREIPLALRALHAEGVSVELCQVRGGARLAGGAIAVHVGQEFELFFKLTGPSEARVRVELAHAGASLQVTPGVPEGRFLVAGRRAEPPDASSPSADWLDGFEPGVRQLFEHLAAHGAVTEPEAQAMLGGPRALRRFSARFEEHAARAPFAVRIDAVGGVKRYVREGANR